jgi:exonuclease III
MDIYKQKYLKYKQKYIGLKKHLGGSNESNESNESNTILKSELAGNIFTKTEYDNQSEENKKKFPFYCPDTNPILCSLSTPNFGLCKNNSTDCVEYTGEKEFLTYDIVSDPSRQELIDKGKNFGYYMQNDKDCSKLYKNASMEYPSTEIKIPDKFKILTWNLWYSLKKTQNQEENEFHYNFFKTRMDTIITQIINLDVDVVCLQEVGKETYDLIYPELICKYPYCYEESIQFDDSNNGPRKRQLETICFSKYPCLSYNSFGVEGNLKYNNSMLSIEFDKFIVFNVYLQAGTKNSPGQKDLWFNYSRCRYNEYLSIKNYIDSNHITKPIIVLGDFNTNLNGNINEWPELKAFGQMGLEDLWLDKYDNTNGFTENTDINLMRWNVKFEEKIFRIDGIFSTQNAFDCVDIKLIGTKPIDIDTNLQQQFIQYRIPKINPIEMRDKLIRKNDQDQIQLWPSDHFGVVAELEIKL